MSGAAGRRGGWVGQSAETLIVRPWESPRDLPRGWRTNSVHTYSYPSSTGTYRCPLWVGSAPHPTHLQVATSVMQARHRISPGLCWPHLRRISSSPALSIAVLHSYVEITVDLNLTSASLASSTRLCCISCASPPANGARCRLCLSFAHHSSANHPPCVPADRCI